MYCKFCSTQIDDDSLFCESCGRQVHAIPDRVRKAHPQRKGRYRKRKKAVCLRTGKLLVVFMLIIVTFFICSTLFSGQTDPEEKNYISLVQDGYLGEFTDITVKEILDGYYGMLYEQEEWDSGETDSGSTIVQAKYYDEGMEEDATTIQFTMLNEECFKITAFIDPLNPVEKATDLLATMNYNYLLAYLAENRSVAGDIHAEKDLIDRLRQISGSSVQFGAAAEYKGNRATICETDGQMPLDISVAMLLDNYGLLDISYYSGNATEPSAGEGYSATAPQGTVETDPVEPSTESSMMPWTETKEFGDFWEKYTTCYDPMAGQYVGPVVDGRTLTFGVTALEDTDGNRVFLLSYSLGGKIVEYDGEYYEVADFVEFPSGYYNFTNRSATVVFTIDKYYPEYIGNFVINLQYTPSGTEYSIYADIPGILDTNGETWIVEHISDTGYE